MEWYPDPADPTRDRYWDGQSWTHNTRPRKVANPHVERHLQQPSPAERSAGASSPQWQATHRPDAQWQSGQPIPRPLAPTTADGVPLAGWWLRVAAFVLDYFALSFVLGLFTGGLSEQVYEPYMAWLGDIRGGDGTIPDPAGYGFMRPLLWLLLIQAGGMLVYHALMVGRFGATLGKLVFGLRVVPRGQGRHTGGLGLGRALWRALVLTLSVLLSLPLLVGALMAATTRQRLSLNDALAGTQVVRSR